MSENDPQASMLFMLGEMRADLKHLVNERSKQADRLDDIELAHSAHVTLYDARLTKLEHFKTRIGVMTAALGVLVPTAITAVAHKLGVL